MGLLLVPSLGLPIFWFGLLVLFEAYDFGAISTSTWFLEARGWIVWFFGLVVVPRSHFLSFVGSLSLLVLVFSFLVFKAFGSDCFPSATSLGTYFYLPGQCNTKCF